MELTELILIELGKQSRHGPMQSRTAGHGKTSNTVGSASNEVLKRTLKTSSDIFQVAKRVKLGLKLENKIRNRIKDKLAHT